MTDGCALCGLPTPDPPVTGDGGETFCCPGCRQVAGVVDETDSADRTAVRERASGGEAAPDAEREDCEEAFLAVEGMHCTTCEAFVALQGEARDGIEAVDASYATDTVRVTYDPETVDAGDLPEALSGYGYTARERHESGGTGGDEATRQRLLVGAVLAFLVMPWYVFFLYPSYVGIETGILSADMTTQAGLYLPMGIVAVFSLGVVLVTGWPILRGAVVSIRTRRPNMDLLLTVAIAAAVGYSLVALVSGSIHLYFDVAIAIVLVVTAGGYYETRLKRAATERLADLTAARVREARRLVPDGEGETETVDVDGLDAGEDVLVRPGERVPVDGTVSEGTAAVDEAVVTGESLPVTKGPGDEVVGGAVVTDSALVVTVGADGESTLDRITNVLWAVQSERPGAQRFADRLATVFVPLVLLLALAVAGWHLLAGDPLSAVVLGGLTVLVAACPCAMGLATPLAVAAGLRDALDRGLVVTSAALFEAAPDVDCVVFDKTGTLTTGEMTVRDVVGDRTAVAAAAALERRSSHPVADAVVDHVTARIDGGSVADGDGPGASGAPAVPAWVTDFERHPGEGISGLVAADSEDTRDEDGVRVVVGTPTLVNERCGPLPEALQSAVANARSNGDVPVVVGYDGNPAAVLTVGDRERDEWASVLTALDDRDVYVLTGDDAAATARFRDHAAVDRVFAGVPPDGKVATVERLGADRTVAMVGDGTNDAPALAAADVGIALEGTARAAEAADVAVFDGDLSDVPRVLDLARRTRRRIRENVGWALCYNGVALPLAAVGALNPLLAAVAMAGSSVLVVTNSRRRLLPEAEPADAGGESADRERSRPGVAD